MNEIRPTPPFPERIEAEATMWILRQDRGLTAAEQDAISHWLAADPRHGACLARHRRSWERLDGIALWKPQHGRRPNRDLLAPAARPRRAAGMRPVTRFAAAGVLAAAAAVAAVFFVRRPEPTPATDVAVPAPVAAPVARAAPPALTLAPNERRTLADGSAIELNRGAAVSVDYTATGRSVRLERGEAHFTVVRDAARPFVVTAGAVAVRAVGTAFNVRLDAAAVEVLVTEGRVRVSGPAPAAPAAEPPLVEAGQRTVVPLAPAAAAAPGPVVAVGAGELEARLAWQSRLLDFTATPLAEIVAEFNRRNTVQLEIADPALAGLRLSASLYSDNLAGFVHLLETGFGVEAERRTHTVVLRAVR